MTFMPPLSLTSLWLAARLPVACVLACLGSSLTQAPPAALLAASGPHQSHMLHLVLSFGLVGLFLISIVDSSFVPLPIPGISDLMIVFFAAQHTNLILLVAVATIGSALGGYLSFQVGQKGGMEFLEKHVPERIFKRVCGWMEHHAILSVALPAILPPPMPLSPFVLAAGALKMSMRTFMVSFTTSRLLRHFIAAAAGVYYGKQVLQLWNSFSEKWATTILIAFWAILLVFLGIAFWRLYRMSKTVRGSAAARRNTAPPSAAPVRTPSEAA